MTPAVERSNHKVLPEIGPDMAALFTWLEKRKLVQPATPFDRPTAIEDPIAQADRVVAFNTLAAGRKRAEHLTRDDRRKVLGDWRKKHGATGDLGVPYALWQGLRDPLVSARELDLKRLPADAMAFYRPFHFPPFDQWGIYLLVDKLVAYRQTLEAAFLKCAAISPITLMHFIVFEIFHHEFFHHLAESTATTIELVLAASGKHRPVYLEYRQRAYQKSLPLHPHEPLEEALANAYAYNSFTFISRLQAGYKTLAVKVYQAAMAKYWHTEPKGYCEAQHYINGGQIPGAAHLLAMMLQEPSCGDDIPLMNLAQTVMPRGFTAFASKPEIPTCLVGNPDVVRLFLELVPVPVDSYTSLFWPFDTKNLDEFIRKKREAEKAAKKRAAENREGMRTLPGL